MKKYRCIKNPSDSVFVASFTVGKVYTATGVDPQVEGDNDFIFYCPAMYPHFFEKVSYERGDVVEVRDSRSIPMGWYKRIFLCEIEGARTPIICVAERDKEKFKRGEKFDLTCWDECRPVEEEVLDIKILVNGAEKDPKTFSKESWENLRK